MAQENIEFSEAEAHFAEIIERVASGVHILVYREVVPVARISPVGARIAGLHEGVMTTSDDFDEPLPDEFWLGDE